MKTAPDFKRFALRLVSPTVEASSPSLRGHLEIARIDHWVKNVFVLPGIVVALSIDSTRLSFDLWLPVLLGLLSVCLVASSNYVINELIDAGSDLRHPAKNLRPVPSGRVHIPLAYVQWLLLMVMGVSLGWLVSTPFAATMLVLWIMGCIYNIPPIRSKDYRYIDVLSEAINNPLRLLAGWFIVGTEAIPPLSLLLSYWLVGCYFMAIKRFAELRLINNPVQAAAYRRSFRHYTEQRLLVSITFYGSAAMLFLGAFIMRYRLELIFAFPLLALIMSIYLALAFKKDSAAYAPERLIREASFMTAVVLCAFLIGVLLWVDIPLVHRLFPPTARIV